LLTAGLGGPNAKPPRPPLPPELAETKIRVEREQCDRDFIKAASEMAEADLQMFKDQLAETDLGPAWDVANRSLLQGIRTNLPLQIM
jgi:hypothetical protein